MQKFTLAQLLATIKVYEARILKATPASYIGMGQGLGENRIAEGGQKPEVLETLFTGNWQRIQTLLINRAAMKDALIAANNSTMVTIGASTMTIAQAVERKQATKFQSSLLAQFKSQVLKVNTVMESKSAGLKMSLDKLVTDSTTSSTKAAVMEANRADLRSIHEPFLIDPMKMVDQVRILEDGLEDFLNNVDYALSAVNALTTVEVEMK